MCGYAAAPKQSVGCRTTATRTAASTTRRARERRKLGQLPAGKTRGRGGLDRNNDLAPNALSPSPVGPPGLALNLNAPTTPIYCKSPPPAPRKKRVGPRGAIGTRATANLAFAFDSVTEGKPRSSRGLRQLSGSALTTAAAFAAVAVYVFLTSNAGNALVDCLGAGGNIDP